MQWLRRSFITGFVVTVPLVISVAALVWVFQVVDGFTGPLYARWLGRVIPGLGLVTTAMGVLLTGVLATNVIGKRVLLFADSYLLRVPVFRTIYAPVKQVVLAFSPDKDYGFKRVVLVEGGNGDLLLGFLTKEFTLERGRGPEALAAVYVPTNHLYLGDVRVYPLAAITFPDLSVEQAIRIVLTGGMGLDNRVRLRPLPVESPVGGRKGERP